MEINEDLNDYNNFPERDGIILPEDLHAAYDSGITADVDMLIGTNADETRYWIGEVGGFRIYQAAVPLFYKSTVNRIADEDKGYARAFMALQNDNLLWNATEFLNDLLFRVPAISQASAHERNGGKVYMYYWTKISDIPHYGACHAVELAYVFNNPQADLYTDGLYNEKLADTVQDMWVNFARTGDPGTEEYAWEPYTRSSRKTMVLGEEIGMNEDLKGEERELVEPLMQHYINGCYTQLDYNVPQLWRIIGMILVLLALAASGIILIVKTRKKRHTRSQGDKV